MELKRGLKRNYRTKNKTSEEAEAERHFGLTPRGTIFIIPTAIKRKLITKETVKQVLARLIEVNFYMSATVYRDALKSIGKL